MPFLVLFDIDGTILRVKSHSSSRQMFAGMIKDIFGKEIPLDKMPHFAGMTDLEILRHTAEVIGLSQDELEAMLPRVWEKMEETFGEICLPEFIELIPGADSIIRAMARDKKYQLGLLTGNFKANAYMKLKAHGLDKFFPFGAFGCEEEDRNKLAKLAIQRANEYAGKDLYSAKNTVIVGDTPRDIACAKANGIPVISIATGTYSFEDLSGYDPDIIIENFDTFINTVNMIMNRIIVAIDGPAGSGKTTTARIAAGKLGYVYIDTGAMYRAVTLAWLNSGKEMTEENLSELVNNITIELKPSGNGQRTFLNGVDVSEAIRMPEVTKNVSPVSAMACVREKLVDMQRQLGSRGGVVMDGRDIGTVVFPNAQLKIFLIASIEARAKRRAEELRLSGVEVSEEEIQKQIADRDAYDSGRKISPLTKANDAVVIDTSDLTIEEQTEKVYQMALSVINHSNNGRQ